ncbi:unnamed protein product [Paramecium pentaurelia]|uniref:Uncharacterized protein n=1 Tax=Paramecium pentaurelia TaxID=43138 RepID=A0A8S1VXG2_9CILI|nr:unnamed protein product [Paramecium pentaurelia]
MKYLFGIFEWRQEIHAKQKSMEQQGFEFYSKTKKQYESSLNSGVKHFCYLLIKFCMKVQF